MRQRARLASEVFADGTYRSVSNVFATLYTLHAVFDNVTFPIFFILMTNERKRTFRRAFVVVKRYTGSLDPGMTKNIQSDRIKNETLFHVVPE